MTTCEVCGHTAQTDRHPCRFERGCSCWRGRPCKAQRDCACCGMSPDQYRDINGECAYCDGTKTCCRN